MTVPRMTQYRWLVVALLFFAITINYIDRAVLVLLCYVLTYSFGLPGCPHAMEPKSMAAQPGSVS